MEQLQKAAKVAFASEFTFYLKAHFFHWNVEGINFQELHALFDTINSEVYGAIDPFAEKIRALLSVMAPKVAPRYLNGMLLRILANSNR